MHGMGWNSTYVLDELKRCYPPPFDITVPLFLLENYLIKGFKDIEYLDIRMNRWIDEYIDR